MRMRKYWKGWSMENLGESVEKRKKFIINFVYWLIIGGIVFLLLKYGLTYIMPFIIGFGIAWILRRPIRFLAGKCHVRQSVAAIFLVILFYSAAGTLLSLLGIRIVTAFMDLFAAIPNWYTKDIQPALMDLIASLEVTVSRLDASVVDTLNEVAMNLVKSLGEMLSGFSVKAIGAVSNYASALPGFLIRVLFAVISSFFFAVDYEKVTGFAMRQMKEKHQKMVIVVKNYVVNTLFKCIRSYALIMFITFVELSLGLTILGIENSVFIALCIAVFDILPVLGTGGVMIPWTVLEAIQGNYSLAIGLLAVYLVVTVIRNIIEPKIVGSQVGLHPLVTLMSMFVGAQLFGVLGLFGLPITLSLLKNLNDQGVIHIFKSDPYI